MRVDETRSEDSTATIDDLGARVRILEIARGSDRGDATVADGDSGVTKNPGLFHLCASSRASGTSASYYLGGVDEEKVVQGLVIRELCGVKDYGDKMTFTEDYLPCAFCGPADGRGLQLDAFEPSP
jgi:hypothetical protein